jgi:CHRD domain/PEP-CTERM motif
LLKTNPKRWVEPESLFLSATEVNMYWLRPVFMIGLVLLLSSTQANAITNFTANLTNSQEVPPTVPTLSGTGAPRPASFGTATFTLNDAMTALVFTATIFNIDVCANPPFPGAPSFGCTGPQTADINDNLVAAHIHAPAPPGTNASVRWGFFGTPFNETNPNDFSLVPFSTGVGGTFSGKWDVNEGNTTPTSGPVNLTNQLPDILAGLSYINFHTTQFGGGEIRGQILPVPEPSSFALLGIGLLAVGCVLSQWTQKRGR